MVEDEDVLESFLSIKSNAVGFDEIHPIFIKAILPVILKYITHLFNTILMNGIFPSSWKRAKIIPVPKNKNEYRPIAILPFISKVFEKIMSNQIQNFLKANKLLCRNQSGFRAKHSCTTALVNVVEEIRQSIDNNLVTYLTLLDFSKAFDTVNHDILCKKLLNQFRFSHSSTKLICSYLQDRYQAVAVNNTVSSFLPLCRGVPQGSVLGPLLFSMYINDLPSCLAHCSIDMYADDVQLRKSCSLCLIENGAWEVNEDLKRITCWCKLNCLYLNPSKSKCIVISRKVVDTSYFPVIYLNNSPIEFVDSAKNLGLIFNKTLSWNDHITATVGKLYGSLRVLWTTQKIIPLNTRKILAKTLLIPIILYGCELFANCDCEHKRKLNIAYNSIARYIYGRRRFDHISTFSKSIHGLTLDNLLKFKTLTLLHGVMQTHQPSYLYDRISLPRSNRNACLVPIRCNYLVSERQFFAYAFTLWNSLPRSIRLASSHTLFKGNLRQYLENSS